MHKLIIASSTTLQISATLHKLLPVHPTGHMLRVQIFMWEKHMQVVDSFFVEQIIYMYRST